MASQVLKRPPSSHFFGMLIAIGQIVGVFPISLLDDGKDYIVKFQWFSLKTIYSIFHVVLQSLILLTCIYFGGSNDTGWNFPHIVRSIFHASNVWCTLSLLQLIRKWPKFMKRWNRTDQAMEVNYGLPPTLQKRSRVTTAVVVVYCLAHIATFSLYNYYAFEEFTSKKHLTYTYATYFKWAFPHVFEYIPYSIWAGLLCQMNYIFCIMRMGYTDLLICQLSSFLSVRFQQVTTRMATALNKKRSIEFWKAVREDYDKIANLSMYADDVITNVVFVSYCGNLILLLVYLRNTTMVTEMNIQKLYNVYNFVIFVVRILTISLYVSWVNDESKQPASILNSVSTTQYNSEIQRFLLQLSFNNVAFTGNKMFRVTRSIILHIGGVILTYELVLVQFSELHITP